MKLAPRSSTKRAAPRRWRQDARSGLIVPSRHPSLVIDPYMSYGSGGGGPTGVRWNFADKHADVTLHSSDLGASKSVGGAWRGVRSTNSQTDGFFYFEAKCVSRDPAGGAMIGIATGVDSLTTYPGAAGTTTSAGFYYTNATRQFYRGGSLVSSGGAGVVANQYAGFAVRISAATGAIRIWARTSNVTGWLGGGDPSLDYTPTTSYTVTPGTAMFAIATLYSTTDSLLANFGDSAFAMTIPLGAVGWKEASYVAPTYADPWWPKVALLAAFTGVDGATTATDLAGRHTLTFSGNAQIDTGDADFGSGALQLDGVSDYVTVSDNTTDFSIPAVSGTEGDFTIEVWHKPTSFAQFASFGGNYAGAPGGWRFGIELGGGALNFRNGDGGSNVHSRAVAVALNTRAHSAFCRSGSTSRIFHNGTQVGADITAWNVALGNTNNLAIGTTSLSYPTADEYSGWLSYVRITRGARYTANFTPPAVPYAMA